MKTPRLNRVLLAGLLALLAVAFGQVPLVPPPEAIPTRLEQRADGSVAVLFQGQTAAVYQIYYSDALADAPEQMAWSLAADNLIAADGWSEWVDIGGPGRLPPSSVTERYYQVVLKVAPAPLPGRDEDVAPTTAAAEVTATTEVEPDITDNALLARLKEAYDSGRLIGALTAGNYAAVIEILREHGVSEATLALLAARLGRPIAPVALADDFFRAAVCWPEKNAERGAIAAGLGYPRTFWLSSETTPPDWSGPAIGAFVVNVREPNVIAYFKWFDEHAEQINSLVLNWGMVCNEAVKDAYPDALAAVSGLYQLAKARKPEVFAWLIVVQLPDGSDRRFLEAVDFQPDGVLVGNLSRFRSPFERTIKRLKPLVAADTPLAAFDFHAYWPHIYEADPVEFGRLAGPHLPRLERRLHEIGYRGLVCDYLLLEKIHQSRQ